VNLNRFLGVEKGDGSMGAVEVDDDAAAFRGEALRLFGEVEEGSFAGRAAKRSRANRRAERKCAGETDAAF
jgi:hypothetical protein